MRSLVKAGNPLDDQGIFISIIVRNQTRNLEFQLRIKSLRSKIAYPHFCPYLFKVWSIHSPSEKSGPNAFSSMVWVNGNRDHMPVFGEDDVTQDIPFRLIDIVIDQKGMGIERVEVKEGHPVIRRFGEGLAFDSENRI